MRHFRIRPADTAMLLRQALAKAFPGTPMTLTVAHLSTGLVSATIAWSDGPEAAHVQAIADRYTGGSINEHGQLVPHLRTHNGRLVAFGIHAVYTNRSISPTDPDEGNEGNEARAEIEVA